MAFDLIRRRATGTNWSRGGVASDVGSDGRGGHGKMLVVGAVAGIAAAGGWLMFGGKKKPAVKRHATFIMTKTPSGRVYAGPMAGYYRKA